MKKYTNHKGIISENINPVDENSMYILILANNHKVLDLSKPLIEGLKSSYQKQIKNITILPFLPPKSYKSQFITLNEELYGLVKKGEANNSILKVSPYEFNRQITKNEFLSEIIENILKNQNELITMTYMNTPELSLDEKVKILAPNKDLVIKFNNKVNNVKGIVKDLNLPFPKHIICEGIEELVENYNLAFKGPAFISRPDSSSGSGTTKVYSEKDILLSSKLQKDTTFILSELLNIINSPSTLGITASDGVFVAGISDQIFIDSIKYVGNASPSNSSNEQQEYMIKITKDIGIYLRENGYKGPFGVDFMIDSKNELYFTEINPRLIGATPELALAHKMTNPNLPTLPTIIYNSVIKDTIGFNPQLAKIPQIPWESQIVKGSAGLYTANNLKRTKGYTQILDYPGKDVKIISKDVIARIVYRGNPYATRQEMHKAIKERINEIKLI